MSKKRARTKAVIAVLAAKFPKCLAVPDTRRRPLKVGIDADLLAALGGSIRRTELIRALAIYCSSDGYLERVLAGACASIWKANLQASSVQTTRSTPSPNKRAPSRLAAQGTNDCREQEAASAVDLSTLARTRSAGMSALATVLGVKRGSREYLGRWSHNHPAFVPGQVASLG